MPLGDAITILDRSNSGWYRVQYGSYTGYMSSDYIDVLGAVQETPPSEEDTATRWNGRTTAFVNLRSGPSTGYRIYLTVRSRSSTAPIPAGTACSTAATPAT